MSSESGTGTNRIAIATDGLGKLYRLGAQEGYKALRDSIMDTLKGVASRIGGNRNGRESALPPTIWALRDVTLSVNHGEVLGVVGRNGAGKSTLLKILSKVTRPTRGTALIYGRVGSLLEVGTGFHPELTGRENVFLNGAILGMKKWEIREKFDAMVGFAEMEKFIDTPVKRYSSGMYMRLAFSVAAHLDPEIMLVDEVLAVGDAEFQKKCLGKMHDASKAGRTVIFVSHNMSSLQSLCTRGILLKEGRIEMDGPIMDVIRRYLESEREETGEIRWNSPQEAPGDEKTRIRAVRVVSEGRTTGIVKISEPVRIEIDYWNLDPGSRRIVGINIFNLLGTCVISSGNLPSTTVSEDPWYVRPYPRGLFRSSCTIPGHLLNSGPHNLVAAVHRDAVARGSVRIPTPLSFIVQDAPRQDYAGEWIGAVRPRLHWETTQLDDATDASVDSPRDAS